ncbi:MAG: RDD family protein, partial [Proteobacteria bacterium]|nr:RDD family protein [Pseudomonadota bacterium]
IVCPKCKFEKEVPLESIPIGAKNIKCPLCSEVFKLPAYHLQKVGFFVRLLAIIIDTLIVNATFIILGFVLDYLMVNVLNYFGITDEELVSDIIGGTIYFFYLFFFPTYFIYLTYKFQATIGKKILGIKVVSANDNPLTLGRIIKRETIGKILSSLLIGFGFFMIIFTRNKQALHDKIAKTYVVYN